MGLDKHAEAYLCETHTLEAKPTLKLIFKSILQIKKRKEKKLPGKENAFHHFKVLKQHIPLGFLAQASYRVSDAKLDGAFEGRGRSLGVTRKMLL